jgi:hypothetical protein
MHVSALDGSAAPPGGATVEHHDRTVLTGG